MFVKDKHSQILVGYLQIWLLGGVTYHIYDEEKYPETNGWIHKQIHTVSNTQTESILFPFLSQHKTEQRGVNFTWFAHIHSHSTIRCSRITLIICVIFLWISITKLQHFIACIACSILIGWRVFPPLVWACCGRKTAVNHCLMKL